MNDIGHGHQLQAPQVRHVGAVENARQFLRAIDARHIPVDTGRHAAQLIGNKRDAVGDHRGSIQRRTAPA